MLRAYVARLGLGKNQVLYLVAKGIDLVKRVVVGASLGVDLFVGRNPVRVRVAETFFELVQKEVIKVYAPRLFSGEDRWGYCAFHSKKIS